MATSVQREHLAGGEGNMMVNPGTGIAFDIEISECVISNSPVPKWLRQRLQESLESKTKSLDDIETRLKEADLRRQQFHEWLVNKARPKRKVSPPPSAQSEDLAQRLEAKLSAAEHKRAELQAQEHMRLAKIHELRLAAKAETHLRIEREREELGCKVESRVHQAETNRLALLQVEKQRRAAANKRSAHSAVVRTKQEGKDRERIEALRLAICQKIAAAEEKRACLIEAGKCRAQAIVLQARRVAEEVVRERELERRTKREKLEARLQRARGQRAEFLRQRGGCNSSCHQKLKQGDRLCRKLTRCWRQFRQSRCTTHQLAQHYAACGLDGKSVTSVSFEELASRITSPTTLRSVKALLARIESRLKLSLGAQSTPVTSIDHLLKHVSLPTRKSRPSMTSILIKKGRASRANKLPPKSGAQRQIAPVATKVKDGQKAGEKELDRYPARVFLCAYMILEQPEGVFSTGTEQREVALSDAAGRLLPAFESLIGTILDGPSSTPAGPSSPNGSPQKRSRSEWPSETTVPVILPSPRPFAAQLAAFDAAWCAYLYHFVAWKVKDARVLEEEMTRMACQLEVSMLQKCKVPLRDGYVSDLNPDVQAIRTQVLEDQKLLQDRILHLTGKAGFKRMQEALKDARFKHAEALENGSPLYSPFVTLTGSGSSSISFSPDTFGLPPPKGANQEFGGKDKPKVAVQSHFEFPHPIRKVPVTFMRQGVQDAQEFVPVHQGTELTNENIVNEMLHDAKWQLKNAGTSPSGSEVCSATKRMIEIQTQVRTAMENAFWDSIAVGLAQKPTDYKRFVSLIGEVREELEAIVPEGWKDELRECMDLELIAQILESGTNDVEHLQRLLDYASGLILKLGSPARDSTSKAAHDILVKELSASLSSAGTNPENAFFITIVKGLRFIFEQLQVLKQDISATRLQALAPLISGTVGMEYMRKAFSTRYQLGAGTNAAETNQRLPNTLLWFTESFQTLEQERIELESSIAPVLGTVPPTPSVAAGLPPPSSMRTGGRIGVSSGLAAVVPTAGPGLHPSGGKRFHEVQWQSNFTLVRLGLLRILRRNEPATELWVPETLALNTTRLQDCQNAFQRILVIATGLLVARQGLTSQGISGLHLEDIMEKGKHKLEILLNEPTASLTQIGTVLAEIAYRADEVESSNTPVTPMSAELMTSVLRKSLSPEDPVFARVSGAVGASIRALLILGKSSEGMAVAESALKRIGGIYLMDKVVATVEALEVIAEVTCKVHEPWYSCIVSAARTPQ